MTASKDARTAVDKALALLQAFGADGDTGVGVSELARRTELSKSTAFRVLAMLERNGAVERAGSNYRLGPLLTELTTPIGIPAVEGIREVLTPFLAHLYERTRQTVHLAILQDTEVVYLNKLHGLHQVPSPSRIGGRIPAYCTAVGKMLLSHDPDLIERVLVGDLPQWTEHTMTDPTVLRAELAQIREAGISYDHEEIRIGLNCVAAPVLTPGGIPVAGLSVSGPTRHFDPRSQAKALREVCTSASRAYAAMLRARRRERR